ncbi:Hypothetical protein FKW44_001643 [Caligus rogercresseyi]|uniref:Uncharacterized protein n=1 Tax=Caligus rogercresseyi TaxID=217165 RepID=A0A7T8QVR5_CALRO|nr:Hypothetical protein FKW44_001643 [Caligus rogercresseyi]
MRAADDLGMTSYFRRRRQLLTNANKESIKGKKFLNRMKSHSSTIGSSLTRSF